MRIVLPLLLGLALLALVAWHFMRTPPSDLARQLKRAAGVALILAAVGLVVMRQVALALPIGIAGLMILRRQAAVRAAGSSAQTSHVRSAGLEMRLDHDTGEMDGHILAGRHEGRKLSELDLRELLELGEEFSGDPESSRLLESYLDRTQPGWREDVHADQAKRQGAAPASGGMGTQEAYQILGLQPGASEAEVREAHRRLMKQVHPDRGGSSALAAKINEAKDRILGTHR
jgi:hypothetical protein